MVKQNSTRRSILDSPQVNCTACVHWSGEHVFYCFKAGMLTICMGRMGLASGKGRSQTDPRERGGLRNGGGTAEMADARHTRKRSLCISNLRIMEQKTCIRCKQTKPITEFGRLKSTEDGMNPRCKSCLREYANQAYSKRKSTLPARRGGVHNPDLAGYTDRKLLEELKARGFVWSDMKRIQPVKYDSI